jgi:hypothetical protein
MSSNTNFLRKFGPYILVVLPILAYSINWTLHPSYWFPADPGAWYFLDSLAIFTGKTYAYVDHPGTPLHLIGSFLLGLTYVFFENHEAFIEYHLRKPELFFVMSNVFLLAMNGLTAIVFYKTVSQSLQNKNSMLAGLALSLLFFILHPQSFESLNFWSHNSFNYPFATLWLIWLYREIRQNRIPTKTKLFMLGTTAGMISMTQMYFLGLIAAGTITIIVLSLRLSASLVQAFKNALLIATSSLLGIVLMLLPIYNELPRFASWVWRILSNQGIYGTGESGFYSLEMIPLSISFWWASIPGMVLTFLAMLALLCTVIALEKTNTLNISPADLAMLSGLLVQTALLLVVLSKLYVKLRYMLSIAAILPILLFILLKILENSSWNLIRIQQAAYVSILVVVAMTLNNATETQKHKAFVHQDAAQARSLAVSTLAQIRQVPKTEIVVVYGSATPIKCAGLLMANNWIQAFDQEIHEICPNQHSIYDTPIEIDLTITHPIPDLDDIDWDIVIAPGNHSGLQDRLREQGAVNIPNEWGINRLSWFFIRPDK